MNIGQAASSSGVSAKMIRHYEAIGLIPKISRSLAGYRHYQSRDIHLLRFIRRARAAGFSTMQIKKLLSLWQDQQRPAREVKQLAATHLADLQTRIAELQTIARALTQLVEHCHGGERPQCPILDNLAGDDTGRLSNTRQGD
ncbi:MAG: Cu(I)-responsive transcriptional regulator [Nitrosomonas sp.]|uniref:Cu(I)-responsive transcriptional regulator n=1 Tax=Nitrosomonas sp. TaxID=42353 RepID=UPI001DDE3A62|nr:Cu(I)-responsive transcriptional regulator [Nitrosomonas sp.]MBX9896267.1 Cu(I)-responsive transcriptional regulator [Nitrosomonas sp.]